MSEICIISATNRFESKTLKIAKIYQKLLAEINVNSELLSLENLPLNLAHTELYGMRSLEFQKTIDDVILPANKYVFIIPEYNGSFPGVLKIFIDAISPKVWAEKKAALIGVAAGKAGNLLGMAHFSDILCHLKINVFHNKIPISNIDKLLDENAELNSNETKAKLNAQISGFLKF